MLRVLSCVLFAYFVWTPNACVAGTIVSTQVCWKGDGSSDLFQSCSQANVSQVFSVVTANPGHPDQVFNGSATASGGPGTWNVALALDVTNYRRDMYVWSQQGGGINVATTGSAEIRSSDTITVNGGSGFYSLDYIFSLDGELSTTDASLFSPSFCTSLLIPQGVGTLPVSCNSKSQVVHSTTTLTYTNLAFGAPIDPTIDIHATGLITPIFAADIPAIGDSTIAGGVDVNFDNSVHLASILVTDENGNPIRGISITSQAGVVYPLDPRNSAVPEPAWLAPVGLLALAVLARFRR